MSNITDETTYFHLCSFDGVARTHDPVFNKGILSVLIIITLLSPIAVTGNAFILAAVWRNQCLRTPFYFLLCGLAFTDLFTGLITQPFYVASELICLKKSQEIEDRLSFLFLAGVISGGFGSYFMSMTVIILTCMSIERWLHMTQRFSVTGRRARFIVAGIILAPIPIAVFRSLNILTGSYEHVLSISFASLLFCLVTISTAYFKVFRIIRCHQQQVQASEPSQNFGKPAINLAKYKKSIFTILYIELLFYISYLPFIVFFGCYRFLKDQSVVELGFVISILFVFLSSSLNPCIYLWRMNDIRNGVKQLIC
ncbi:histamine H2 receptor-like [Oculina patagonica]